MEHNTLLWLLDSNTALLVKAQKHKRILWISREKQCTMNKEYKNTLIAVDTFNTTCYTKVNSNDPIVQPQE